MRSHNIAVEKLLWAAYSLLKRSSDEFQSGRRLRLSVEELVICAMDSAALKTSYRPDLLYVGHMILYHRFRGDAQHGYLPLHFSAFWRQDDGIELFCV